MSEKESQQPPAVITVDDTKEGGATSVSQDTPKHANKEKGPGQAPSSAFESTTKGQPSFPPQQISPGGHRYYQQPPPPPYYYQQPGYPNRYHPGHHYPGHYGPPHQYYRGNEPFSRAVSSSFDRKTDPKASAPLEDDASWGQLNQVTSVDDEDIKQREHKRRGSLASLASAAEAANDKNRPQSSASNGSLDLLKCASGSTSNMLLPADQRASSQLSFDGKREREEAEDDEQEPDSKKKKLSPLLPLAASPSMDKLKPHAMYPKSPQLLPDSFYEKASFAQGLDTAPTLPRELPKGTGTTPIPPRPGSSASNGSVPGVNQLPSFDLAQQGSFGGESAGGGLMISSFSFADNYPMIGPSESQEQVQMGHPLESRNQSFEGYPPHYEYYDSYRMGPYPPHAAPSWGSHGSYYPPPPPHYHGRMPYPPVMRNPSNDSGRASPPSSFQPPPEFRAPPSAMEHKRKGTIMATSYVPSVKNGPFGWSKDEDNRLNDIMKKHKNPRNWEPIAAELNTGRSAKEVHERWIRYLKPGVRKGQWTDAEDAIVMEAVTTSTEQPFTRWSDLANRLPGRVGKQIRDRWVNHLNPNINHLPFTKEDDLLLWEGHKSLGKRWVEISAKYFNSSRSENHIKNRWYSASFKKFISSQFGPDAYAGSSKKEKSPQKKGMSPKRSKQEDVELTAV